NRLGSTFHNSTVEDTGFNPCDVVRAYVMARDGFELRDVWHDIEALDETVPVEIQVELFLEIQKLVERVTLWFLRNESHPLNIQKAVELYRPSIQILASCIEEIVFDSLLTANKKKFDHYIANNVPYDLAKTVSIFEALASACDIIHVAERDKLPVNTVGKIYFEIGALLNMGWLRTKISELPKDGYWERLSCSSLIEDTYTEQMRITAEVISSQQNQSKEISVDISKEWVRKNKKDLNRYHSFIKDIKNSEHINFNMLVIATKRAESICNLGDED
ncbi:MAG: NAD-glutamate dehydrogenase, partial [Rickettsiales bacterium]|nr:NAD-glutamate dehydrogenase [Rickettsiales bacterium]